MITVRWHFRGVRYIDKDKVILENVDIEILKILISIRTFLKISKYDHFDEILISIVDISECFEILIRY